MIKKAKSQKVKQRALESHLDQKSHHRNQQIQI
jgi:hypothetical protein